MSPIIILICIICLFKLTIKHIYNFSIYFFGWWVITEYYNMLPINSYMKHIQSFDFFLFTNNMLFIINPTSNVCLLCSYPIYKIFYFVCLILPSPTHLISCRVMMFKLYFVILQIITFIHSNLKIFWYSMCKHVYSWYILRNLNTQCLKLIVKFLNKSIQFSISS